MFGCPNARALVCVFGWVSLGGAGGPCHEVRKGSRDKSFKGLRRATWGICTGQPEDALLLGAGCAGTEGVCAVIVSAELGFSWAS